MIRNVKYIYIYMYILYVHTCSSIKFKFLKQSYENIVRKVEKIFRGPFAKRNLKVLSEKSRHE